MQLSRAYLGVLVWRQRNPTRTAYVHFPRATLVETRSRSHKPRFVPPLLYLPARGQRQRCFTGKLSIVTSLYRRTALPFTMRSTNGSSTFGGKHGARVNDMSSVINEVNGVAQSYAHPDNAADQPYRVLDQHHREPQPLRVACIGACASGLCLACKMEKMLEAAAGSRRCSTNGESSETWYESRNPKVACTMPVCGEPEKRDHIQDQMADSYKKHNRMLAFDVQGLR